MSFGTRYRMFVVDKSDMYGPFSHTEELILPTRCGPSADIQPDRLVRLCEIYCLR